MKAWWAPDRRQGGESVGEEHPLVGGQLPDRESDVGLGVGPEQAQGKAEVHRQLEIDVEELRPQEQGIEMGIEMADVEAPQDGPLDLGPALPADLVDVGVIPDVGDRPRESAVPVEERRCLGDRCPPVEVVLGVEGELDPDVVTAEPGRRLPGPRGRDDERGAGADPLAQRVVDAHGGGVAQAEVGAVEDEQLGVGRVVETFGDRRHPPDRSAVGPQAARPAFSGPFGFVCRAVASCPRAGPVRGDPLAPDATGLLVEAPVPELTGADGAAGPAGPPWPA